MRPIRTTAAAALVAALALSVAATVPAGAKARTRVVGVDPRGDWGPPAGTPGGDVTGQDLVAAAIRQKDRSTLELTIAFAALPGQSVPSNEYLWAFDVGSEADAYWLLSSCPGDCATPPQAGILPFRLQHCTRQALGVYAHTTCSEEAVAHAIVDASAATVSVPVDLATLGADAGAVVGPAEELAPIHVRAVSRKAELYFDDAAVFPGDTLEVTKSFVVR
ncbi:MAG TPA: hypothetical protein VHJ76_00620 [Actinomycetota bacterium]|nr:hypothetical protein [Actinomycetota bacterium]